MRNIEKFYSQKCPSTTALQKKNQSVQKRHLLRPPLLQPPNNARQHAATMQQEFFQSCQRSATQEQPQLSSSQEVAPQKYHKINCSNPKSSSSGRVSIGKKIVTSKKALNNIFKRIKTQCSKETQPTDKSKRHHRRRMCKLKTEQQLNQEYEEYVVRKEKENVEELFRHVNREMQLSFRKNEGNIFYQNIRKEAQKKVQHMYCNQKYYDDEEVKHLHSVIESCDVLIHKKHTKIDAKPLYHIPRPHYQNSHRKNTTDTQELSTRMKTMILKRGTKTGGKELGQQDNKLIEDKGGFRHRYQHSVDRLLKTSGNNRQKVVTDKTLLAQSGPKRLLSAKIDNLMSACAVETQDLREVKTGMKIFGFYCDRLMTDFQTRETRLDNYLKWQDL